MTIDPSHPAPTGRNRLGTGPGQVVRRRLRPVAAAERMRSLGWTSLPGLPGLRPPTLILAGDDDPIIPLVNARILHRLIPRSQLHIYHGGHLELAADAEHIAPVVDAFLSPGGAENDTGR